MLLGPEVTGSLLPDRPDRVQREEEPATTGRAGGDSKKDCTSLRGLEFDRVAGGSHGSCLSDTQRSPLAVDALSVGPLRLLYTLSSAGFPGD